MCKSHCWYYTCGHWSDHRLSTCRGRFATTSSTQEPPTRNAACTGSSSIPPISVLKPCAVCNKAEIIKDWRQTRSQAVSTAIRRGKDTQPVYEYFGRVREEIEMSVPRSVPFTAWRPGPRAVRTPLTRGSPLSRELKVEDLEVENDGDDEEMLDIERLEIEGEDTEMRLSGSSSAEEDHQSQPGEAGENDARGAQLMHMAHILLAETLAEDEQCLPCK